jgi:uncharacterized membrane protein
LLSAFGVALSYNLAFKSILWDETPHLYGSLLLSQGLVGEYLGVTFYPPLFDGITGGLFAVFGASLWLGRFISVVFALLTLVALYKLADRAYGRRVAFLSCLFMAAMPAFIWVARLSILETALEFFLVLCFWLFLEWLHRGDQKFVLLSGLALGCAFLIKYQAIIAGSAILIALPLMLGRDGLKQKIGQFKWFIAGAAVIMVPVLAALTISGGIAPWLSLLQINSAQANVYSARFPIPIFYIIESTFPGMQLVHPISTGVFILGALGLGLFALRRKPQDRFFVVWLLVIYVFFSLIASRTWRYVIPLYPVVAVAGASFVMALYGRAEKSWKSANNSVNMKRLGKVVAVLLIAGTASAVVYSAVDAERWIADESVYIPLPEATHYVASRINGTDELLVLCPINNLNINVLKFYLSANEDRNNAVVQYPSLPPDSFNMNFNAQEVALLCRENCVKYVLLDENTGYRYFNSTLTAPDVADLLVSSGNFTLAQASGLAPFRVFVSQVVPT